MLQRLIDFAISQRYLVLILLAVVMTAAAFTIPKLNLDAFPDVTNVQVAVNTEAPGLAAQEVEQLITYPIEAVMYAFAKCKAGSLYFENRVVWGDGGVRRRDRYLFC